MVFLKCKVKKVLNKFTKKLDKIGGVDKNINQSSDHSIAINIGEAPPKSYLGVRAFKGVEAKAISEELNSKFENG